MSSLTFIAVAIPFPGFSGGCYRAFLALSHYAKASMRPLLVLPYMLGLRLYDPEVIKRLEKWGVTLSGYSYLRFQMPHRFPLNEIINNTLLSGTARVKLYLSKNTLKKVSFVLSFHETHDSILTAYLLARKLNIKVGAVLQLPPFYGNRNRLQNIRKARAEWFKVLYGVKGKFIHYLHTYAEDIIEKRTSKILKKFDLLIAVSKSIPYEMGVVPSKKLHVLDPGVALDNKDLELIKNYVKRSQL